MKNSKQPHTYTPKLTQPNNIHDISSAKYSDISSYWLRDAKNNNTQLHDISLTPIDKNKTKNKFTQFDAQILNDSNQLTQYFYEEDSLLSLNQIFPQQQFRGIAKQIAIQPMTRQAIVHKFYKKGMEKNRIDHSSYGKYYVQYLQWKQNNNQSNQPISSTNSHKIAHRDKNNKQLQVQSLINKQMQLQKYKAEVMKRNQQISQKEMKMKLKNLSQQYQSRLKANLQDISIKQQSKYLQKTNNKLDKRKQLAYQQIQYPLLNTQQIQKQKYIFKKQQKRWAQMKQKSFIDIIKNPPRSFTKQQNFQIPLIVEKVQNKNRSQPYVVNKVVKKASWQLDIDQILKIPYRQFLLFYQEYKNKIVALSTPEELKTINKYRKQALERQQSLNKLKKKISQSGTEILNKLPAQKKKQLFELLYEEDLQKQKQKLQNF